MSACMGGWCVQREKCANYHSRSKQVLERMCLKGEQNAFQAIFARRAMPAAPSAESIAPAPVWPVELVKRVGREKGAAIPPTPVVAAKKVREPVIPDGLKPKVIPTPRDRWAVDLPKEGGLRNMKPGQYEVEAAGCAARSMSKQGARAWQTT